MAVLTVLIYATVPMISAWNNDLAKKPPVGFSTWNYFKCNFNETSCINKHLNAVGCECISVDAGLWFRLLYHKYH